MLRNEALLTKICGLALEPDRMMLLIYPDRARSRSFLFRIKEYHHHPGGGPQIRQCPVLSPIGDQVAELPCQPEDHVGGWTRFPWGIWGPHRTSGD